MKQTLGFHYTNPIAYRFMQDGSAYGTGLIPIKRFISLWDEADLPNEAYEGVIEGLLEPEPKSWLENPEFPSLWRFLMHDICRESEVMLLSFELKPEDKAYVVERAHIERELYREAKGFGKPTRDTMNEAFKKYWESRVPVFNYKGGYSVPQLSIWTPIAFDRLRIEGVKQTDYMWRNILRQERCFSINYEK